MKKYISFIHSFTFLFFLFFSTSLLQFMYLFFLAIVIGIMFLIDLSMIAGFGYYVFQIFDSYAVTIPLLVIALTQCIAISWVYGTDK